jgi:lysine 2,3-aminomutase
MSLAAKPSSTEVLGECRRHPFWAQVSDEEWGSWRWQMRNRITRLEQLRELVSLSPAEVAGIEARATSFPFAITPYYLSLFGDEHCGVRRQAIPHVDETLRVIGDMSDPLAEEEHSPVACLSHRYPDRALLYVTHNCPVYCRHCTRSRKVGDASSAPRKSVIAEALDYVRATPAIRDLLISGGDPLSLSDDRLVELVAEASSIESLDIIRLCTRNPVTLPQRLTTQLLERLRPYHPLFVSTHFNHPGECTPEAGEALDRLADHGFAVGNQMVLLAGINDDAETVESLNRWLLRHRCRPYYMFQCDAVEGSAHLRTPLAKGLEIIDALRGRVSGLAIPHFTVDLPGGGGKVTLTPDRLVRRAGSASTFRGRDGLEFTFHDSSVALQAVPETPEE